MADLRQVLLPSLPRTMKKFFYHTGRFPWFPIDSANIIKDFPVFTLDYFSRPGRFFTEIAFSHPSRSLRFGPLELVKPSLRLKGFAQRESWLNVERIGFATQALHSSSSVHLIDHLLIESAKAAKYLPNLRVLEMWCDMYPKEHLSIFSYTIDGVRPLIAWRTTRFGYNFSSAVIEAWAEAAASHTHAEEKLKTFCTGSPVPPENIVLLSHSLRTRLLDPFSKMLKPYDFWLLTWSGQLT